MVDQSVAALLPRELLDNIFEHFDFNYSQDARQQQRDERDKTLQSVAVVVRAWMVPAKRLLFRNVTIASWAHLCKTVDEWVGATVRTLRIFTGAFDSNAEPFTCATLVFRLISVLPNLQSIHFYRLPFTRFNPSDSDTLRSTLLLPSLLDIQLHTDSPARSIISDLLLASNRNISSLVYKDYNSIEWSDEEDGDEERNMRADAEVEDLDFQGRLRRLCLNEVDGYTSVCGGEDLERFVGLEELIITSHSIPKDQVEQLFTIIAPTLRKLKVEGEVNYFASNLHHLQALTHLNLETPGEIYYTLYPSLRSLPSTLTSLAVTSDSGLEDFLDDGLPEGLRRLRICNISDPSTLTHLPPLDRLLSTEGVETEPVLQRYLAKTSRGRPAFKISPSFSTRITTPIDCEQAAKG